MKAKLLKRLRKKFSKKYSIGRRSRGWVVWYGGGSNDYYGIYDELAYAQKRLTECVRMDIMDWLRGSRMKGRTHVIKYYPW